MRGYTHDGERRTRLLSTWRVSQTTLLIAITFALLLILAGVYFRHAATSSGHASIDWVGFWIGDRAWERGLNMYGEADARSLWEEFHASSSADVPPQIYPPYYVLVLAPFLEPSLSLSIRLWAAINTASVIAFAAILLCLYARNWPVWVRCAFALAVVVSSPAYFSVHYGNPAPLICACIAASVYFARRNANGRVVLLWLVASLKWTVLGPVLAYYALRRRWKPLAGLATMALALVALSGTRRGPVRNVQDMRERIAELRQHSSATAAFIDDPSPANPLRIDIVNAETLWYDMLGDQPGPVGILSLASAVCLGVVAVFVVWPARPGAANRVAGEFQDPGTECLHLSLISVWGLLAVYHRRSDLLILAFPLAYGLCRIVDGRSRDLKAEWHSLLAIGTILALWSILFVTGAMYRLYAILHIGGLPGGVGRVGILYVFAWLTLLAWKARKVEFPTTDSMTATATASQA